MNSDELELIAIKLYKKMQPHLVNSTPRWLPMAEACKYAGDISWVVMKKLIEQGHVYAKQLTENGKLIVDRETIDAFLDSDKSLS